MVILFCTKEHSRYIKIVSNIDRISFLQTDPVGDKFKARKLELWIEDPFGKQVSSKEEHIFDSASEKLDERKRNIQIKLEGSGFDRTVSYKLIMEDTESKTKDNEHNANTEIRTCRSNPPLV